MWNLSAKVRRVWRKHRQTAAPSYAARFQSRPSIRQLEQRRVLNADFALAGTALTLDNFDAAGESLTITGNGVQYAFELSGGGNHWSGTDGGGVSGNGSQTLTVQAADVESITVNDSMNIDFATFLGDAMAGSADLSGETLTLIGVGSVDQTVATSTTLDRMTIDADGGAFELASLNLTGNLEVSNATTITDAANASIAVSGDATFVAENNITLADQDKPNGLAIGGIATFTSTNGGTIDVGVDSGGAAADAEVDIATLKIATDGSFHVANDATLDDLEIAINPAGGPHEYELASAGVATFDLVDDGANASVNDVQANANLTLTATSGDLLVGQIASTGAVSLTAASGSINDGADDTVEDIAANGITLTAQHDVGAIAGADDKLELAAGSNVSAESTTLGDIRLRGLGALTLANVTTANGSIDVMAAGTLAATVVSAAGTTADAALMTSAGGVAGGVVVAQRNVAIQALNGDIATGVVTATTGSVAINADAGNALVGRVTAGTTVAITTPGGSINDGADDAMEDVAAGGVITLTAQHEIAGVGADGKLELAAGSSVNASSTTTGDVRLRGLGGLTLADVDTVSGSIDVMAAGLITASDVQASGATADIALTTSAGGVTASLLDAERNLRVNATGAVLINGTGASAGGFVKLQSGDSIVLAAKVEADLVGLVAANNISQLAGGVLVTGANLATDGLLVMANGDVLLDAAGNSVSEIAADVDGRLRLRSVVSLAVGAVAIDGMSITGVSADNNANDATANLSLEAKLVAGGDADATLEDLVLRSGVQAKLVGLTAEGDATQTATGIVTTGAAAGEGLVVKTGGEALLVEDNAVTRLAAEANSFFRLQTTTDLLVVELGFTALAIGGASSPAMAPVVGAQADDEVQLASGGTIVVTRAISAKSAMLDAQANIVQKETGVIRGSSAMPAASADLIVVADGNVLLDGLGNVVARLAADVEGYFRFHTIDALEATQLSAPARMVDGAASPAIGPVVGVNSAVEAKLLSDSSIQLSSDVGAPTVFLKATGNVTQTVGIVHGATAAQATALLVTAGGDIDLSLPTNRIQTVDAAAAGTSHIVTLENLEIASLSVPTRTITTPDGMNVTSASMTIPGGHGLVAKYESAGSIAVNATVDADKAGLVAGTSIMQSPGGVIKAGELLLMAENVRLQAGNEVQTLAADVDDDLYFRTTTDLTVSTVKVLGMEITGVSGDGDTTDATLSRSDEVKLQAGGSLDLQQSVEADKVFLGAGTTITQAAAIPIDADELLLMAGGDVTLEADNSVRRLAADLTNGSLAFESDNAITVSSLVADGMRVQGIHILDSGALDNLTLSLKSTGGNIDQATVDPLTAPPEQRAAIDVDVKTATFTVPDGRSILLSDIKTDPASLNNALHRAATLNRFFNDNSGLETELVFATDPAGQLHDLTIVDQTLVELKDINIAGDLIIIGGKSPDATSNPAGQAIVQTNAVQVAGRAQFHAIRGTNVDGELSIDLPNLQVDTGGSGTGKLAVTSNGGDVHITNSVGVEFRADIETDVQGTQGDLIATAGGAIIDEPGATIHVGRNGTFVATGVIMLNEDVADTLTVVGKASFSGSSITIGDAGNFEAGMLNFNSPGNVTIQEDSSTVIAMSNTALALDLRSEGDISDAGSTSVVVAANATLAAMDAVELNDQAADVLTVGMKAAFSGSSISIGEAGDFKAGQLNFNSLGAVTIQEDDSTLIAMSNTADSLDLSSKEGMADDGATSIVVTSDAAFAAGDAVILNDAAGDELTVGGKASFSGVSIAIGAAGAFNAGRLNFNSVGAVTIQEDSSTEIAMSNTAGSLDLRSTADITDADSTSIVVDANATFTTPGAIVLSDQNGDALIVVGDATLLSMANAMGVGGGQDILVGVDPSNPNRMTDSGAQVELGGTNFDSRNVDNTQRGDVSLFQDNSMELFDANYARSLAATSGQSILDRGGTTIDISDGAMFKALGSDANDRSITLADASADSLSVGENASFVAMDAGAIDVGVVPTVANNANRGDDSNAAVHFGTLTFSSFSGGSSRGRVTINEDDATDLDNLSRAQSLVLVSAQSIADRDTSYLRVDELASFFTKSAGQRLILGDGAAQLDLHRIEVLAGAALDVGTANENHIFTDVSLAEGSQPQGTLPDANIVLQNVFAGHVLFVSNTHSAGHILQDLPTLEPVAPGATLTTTLLQAPQAGFVSDTGGVILRNTAFKDFAVDASGAYDIAAPGVADLDSIVQRLSVSTLNPAMIGGLQPVHVENGEIEDLSVGNEYGVVIAKNNGGELTIGKFIKDPGSALKIHGATLDGGHGFIETADDDDLTFTAAGTTPAEKIAVQVSGDFVFTAVAGGQLEITDEARLVSTTGIVNDVHTPANYDSFDGRIDGIEDKAGPLFVITPPALDTPITKAPTSAQVIPDARSIGTQRVRINVGSDGELGFFGDVLWADQLNGDIDGIPFSTTVPNDGIPADVIIPGAVRQLLTALTGTTTTTEVDIAHDFPALFFKGDSQNPNFPYLPTEIRVFNDSSINLFEAGGERNLNRSTSLVGGNQPTLGGPARSDNFVIPIQLVKVLPGEFIQSFDRIIPPTYIAPVVVTTDPRLTFQQQEFDQGRPVVRKLDRVIYGPLGADRVLDDTDELTWEEGTTKQSFRDDIKRTVLEGDLVKFPYGDYQITVKWANGTKDEIILFSKKVEVVEPKGDAINQAPTPTPESNQGAATSTSTPGREQAWIDAWEHWAARPREASTLQSQSAVWRDLEPAATSATPLELRDRGSDEDGMLNGDVFKSANHGDLGDGAAVLDVQRAAPVVGQGRGKVAAGASLIAGSLVMAKYQGNRNGNQWRAAWTRDVLAKRRR